MLYIFKFHFKHVFFNLDRPQFSGVKTEFLVEEGKSAVLSIGVNAYPEVNLDDYSWEKTAEPSISIPKLNRTVPGTRIVSEGGSLTFNSVVLGDAGIYVLKVKNEVGESTVSVKVAILHPPRFTFSLLYSDKIIYCKIFFPDIMCLLSQS